MQDNDKSNNKNKVYYTSVHSSTEQSFSYQVQDTSVVKVQKAGLIKGSSE